jgi:predicted transcriptional regulator
MSNKLIFRKAKELHYKIGGKQPQVQVNAIQDELALSQEEMKYYLDSLKKLRLIRFDEATPEVIEITKVGLNTMI